MSDGRPYALSIAGLDPSGGAGILADIKAFELSRVQGLSVCTSLTFQNDVNFHAVKWISKEDILSQIDVLYERLKINWVKIGLVENMAVLRTIILHLKKINPDVKIIWDPIIKATAGFVFHQQVNKTELEEICREIYLITPNLEEIKFFYDDIPAQEAAEMLAEHTNIFLKGGHTPAVMIRDILWEKKQKQVFVSDKISSDKRGTGCVLSAVILAGLAKGYSLQESCRQAKSYVTSYIKSNQGLLGYHYHE
ncbi:MAG: hydroxymethylpyrimidine/phosphomethylpyrimidine kinase [Cytophagaceae bacterium]